MNVLFLLQHIDAEVILHNNDIIPSIESALDERAHWILLSSSFFFFSVTLRQQYDVAGNNLIHKFKVLLLSYVQSFFKQHKTHRIIA